MGKKNSKNQVVIDIPQRAGTLTPGTRPIWNPMEETDMPVRKRIMSGTTQVIFPKAFHWSDNYQAIPTPRGFHNGHLKDTAGFLTYSGVQNPLPSYTKQHSSSPCLTIQESFQDLKSKFLSIMTILRMMGLQNCFQTGSGREDGEKKKR